MDNDSGNKGFSLVELIIVIAIMAVLIAVLAPMFLRYVERSRQSVDTQAVGGMLSVLEAVAVDHTIEPPPAFDGKYELTWESGNGGDIRVSPSTHENAIHDALGHSAVQAKSNAARATGAEVIITINITDDSYSRIAVSSAITDDYFIDLLDTIK